MKKIALALAVCLISSAPAFATCKSDAADRTRDVIVEQAACLKYEPSRPRRQRKDGNRRPTNRLHVARQHA